MLRFWNHQLRGELEAVRFEIWRALMERTGRKEDIAGCLPKPAPSPQPSPPMGRGSPNAEGAMYLRGPLGGRTKVRGMSDEK